ncbi:methylated-DNA--protein-cysteine methyltransferase isoform X1 [Anabrus simplex]|uniref:methylated-DNA--protein-cysteine methyltransferase isoform X1 n=1 Tax=Anabrus simplex TaxID=316456 RepID=UPI0035A2B6F7
MVHCKEVTLKFTIMSPIGDLYLTVCRKGLHSLEHTTNVAETFTPDMSCKICCLDLTDSTTPDLKKHVLDGIEWLKVYFFDVKSSSSACFPSVCTISETGLFREKVLWTLTRNVGVGEVISYGDLAKLTCGRPGAARAVGTAMATNPIPILFPCHRVIRSDGSMGQYAGGCKNFLKAWLLEHEGLNPDKLC